MRFMYISSFTRRLLRKNGKHGMARGLICLVGIRRDCVGCKDSPLFVRTFRRFARRQRTRRIHNTRFLLVLDLLGYRREKMVDKSSCAFRNGQLLIGPCVFAFFVGDACIPIACLVIHANAAVMQCRRCEFRRKQILYNFNVRISRASGVTGIHE